MSWPSWSICFSSRGISNGFYFHFRYSLLLHGRSSTFSNYKTDLNTTVILCSEINNHAHCSQRSVWESMKVSWSRFFSEKTFINFPVFQLWQFRCTVFKLHFHPLWVLHPTVGRVCTELSSTEVTVAMWKGQNSKGIKKRHYKRQNHRLCFPPEDILRCARTNF